MAIALDSETCKQRPRRHFPQAHGSAARNFRPFTSTYAQRVNLQLPDIDLDQPIDLEDLPSVPSTSVVPVQKNPARLIKDTFASAYAMDAATIEELTPQRLKVAWRVLRHMAMARGLIADDESFETTLGKERDELLDFWTAPHGTKQGQPYPHCGYGLRNLLLDLPGMSLLPPQVEDRYIDKEGKVTPNYDPDLDMALKEYLLVFTRAAMDLNIDAGSPKFPEYGLMGLQPLSSAKTCRAAFPSPLQVIAFENAAIDQALEYLMQHGTAEARRVMHHEHGYRPHESLGLIKLAKVRSSQLTVADIEDEKGLMILKLEDFCRRARESIDLRAELGGLKQLAVVQGLARVEGGDLASDFVDLVKRFSRQGPPPRAALPARIVDVLPSPGHPAD